MSLYLAPLAGGMLLGLASAILLLTTGRIAGISGLFGRLVDGLAGGRMPAAQTSVNAAFLLGMMAGPWLYRLAFGRFPAVSIAAAWPVIIVAGLLVGFGSRMGSGCTSGHGILGLARMSPRSIVAVLTFLATGILSATLSGAWG